MEFLSINLTKYVYAENYKTVMKESKALNKWRDILLSQIGKLNIINISFLSN